MTNAAVRESTLKALQGSTLTRHHGRPTFKSVAKTRKEVAQEYAKAKTSHSTFPMGTKFGMASAVLKTRVFIDMHNTATATQQLHIHPDLTLRTRKNKNSSGRKRYTQSIVC